MLIDPNEGRQFYRLYWSLMLFVNQRLKVTGVYPSTSEEFSLLSDNLRFKVREAFLAEIDLLQTFITENPAHLLPEELDIIASWKHFVAGEFFLLKQLSQYAVFLSSADPPVAYGVLALALPFEQVVRRGFPALLKVLLLPFNGKIIYDGIMSGYNISFGPGLRRSLNERFLEAQERSGIITTLPPSSQPPARTKSSRTKSRKKLDPKDQTAAVLGNIIDMTDRFCQEHLNEEYAQLCRMLAEKLARKRPSPLLGGKANTWACAIIRTIGLVNFLDDPSQSPHMKLTAIDKAFGVGQSTATTKSSLIRKMLKIGVFDPAWTLLSQMGSNPMAWMIEYNGIPVDARLLSRDLQEEAFRKGLIPYIPEQEGTADENLN